MADNESLTITTKGQRIFYHLTLRGLRDYTPLHCLGKLSDFLGVPLLSGQILSEFPEAKEAASVLSGDTVTIEILPYGDIKDSFLLEHIQSRLSQALALWPPPKPPPGGFFNLFLLFPES